MAGLADEQMGSLQCFTAAVTGRAWLFVPGLSLGSDKPGLKWDSHSWISVLAPCLWTGNTTPPAQTQSQFWAPLGKRLCYFYQGEAHIYFSWWCLNLKVRRLLVFQLWEVATSGLVRMSVWQQQSASVSVRSGVKQWETKLCHEEDGWEEA